MTFGKDWAQLIYQLVVLFGFRRRKERLCSVFFRKAHRAVLCLHLKVQEGEGTFHELLALIQQRFDVAVFLYHIEKYLRRFGFIIILEAVQIYMPVYDLAYL